MEMSAPLFGQDDARQISAGRVVNLEATLRSTLRALAVCAARRADARTVRQLVDRARSLADQLDAALDLLDDSVPSRDARAIAAHLEERLVALERLAEDRRGAAVFS
jgi:hypothetical protein